MVSVIKSAVLIVVGIIMVAYTFPLALNSLLTATSAGGQLYFTTPTATQSAVMNIWDVLPIFGVITGLVLIIAPAVNIIQEFV
jgi:hypothetical protein